MWKEESEGRNMCVGREENEWRDVCVEGMMI